MGSFQDHVALLSQFLDRRSRIVDSIESQLLNVRGKPASRSRDRRLFEQLLNSCFFSVPELPSSLSRLKGQLAASHLRDGFEPMVVDQYSHELDPLELIARAYQYWEQHRWPGRSGRLTYAQSIYTVFMLRQLEYLSLRIWDEGTDVAGDRLAGVQRLLDRLNMLAIPNVLIRDARWLIQTAQGPLTRHLQPYFKIAEQVSGSITESSRLECHKAGARLAGGHLRSQLRYRAWNAHRSIDDPEVLAFTRYANSMDTALLVRDLVALLDAYKAARGGRDEAHRLDLADAILQGMSADPELYLTRLDLLTPSTMIEELFIDGGDDGDARYTPLGEAHLKLLERYGELIGQLAEPLKEDATSFDPSQRAYSPYGISYGFVADLMSNMAVDPLVSHPSRGLSLEDMFVSSSDLENKLARAKGWEQLPRRAGEREHFDHSAESAGEMFAFLMDALEARAGRKTESNASKLSSARLLVVAESDSIDPLPHSALPAGAVSAQEYCFTSDMLRARSNGEVPQPRHQIDKDRKEGRFLASGEAQGHAFGISKLLLTLFVGQGKNAVITNVPPSAIAVLRLTCPGLVLRLP